MVAFMVVYIEVYLVAHMGGGAVDTQNRSKNTQYKNTNFQLSAWVARRKGLKDEAKRPEGTPTGNSDPRGAPRLLVMNNDFKMLNRKRSCFKRLPPGLTIYYAECFFTACKMSAGEVE